MVESNNAASNALERFKQKFADTKKWLNGDPDHYIFSVFDQLKDEYPGVAFGDFFEEYKKRFSSLLKKFDKSDKLAENHLDLLPEIEQNFDFELSTLREEMRIGIPILTYSDAFHKLDKQIKSLLPVKDADKITFGQMILDEIQVRATRDILVNRELYRAPPAKHITYYREVLQQTTALISDKEIKPEQKEAYQTLIEQCPSKTFGEKLKNAMINLLNYLISGSRPEATKNRTPTSHPTIAPPTAYGLLYGSPVNFFAAGLKGKMQKMQESLQESKPRSGSR